MNNHEPEGFNCPICVLVSGGETKHNKQTDVVYSDDGVIAFISPKWWPNNPGSVVVVPREHIENIYDISDELLSQAYVVGKKLAVAIKDVYKCHGVSMRQHNEPAGNQDVWHFHLHVLPRWENDKLYQHHDDFRFVNQKERQIYAKKLREYFGRKEK